MINFYDQKSKQNGVKEKTSSPANKLRQYHDPNDGLDARGLSWGFWFVKNKVALHRLAIISLLILDAFFVIFSLVKLGFVLSYDLFRAPAVEQQLTYSSNYASLREHFQPADLQILNVYIFSGGTGKNDAVAEVANPNLSHAVDFDYYFSFGGQRTESKRGFILPGENKLLATLGLDESVFSGGASLMVENLAWRRVSAHQVSDTAAWQAERLNFSISDLQFIPANAIGGASAHIIKFKLTDNAAYGYKNAGFYAGLYQGGGLVGILRFDLQDFKSLETREIDLRSFARRLEVDEVKIFPLIDPYGADVYLPPSK